MDSHSSSDSSVCFDGDNTNFEDVDDDFETGDDNEIQKSVTNQAEVNAMNNLRVHVIKALISILVDGLQVDNDAKIVICNSLLSALTSLQLVPSQTNLSVYSGVTNQIREYMEKLFVTALQDIYKTRQTDVSTNRSLQTLHDSTFSALLKYSQGENILCSRYKQDFKEIEQIGKGGFGSVCKVEKKSDKILYAIKKIILYGNESDVEPCIREIQQMGKLSHTNIIRYFDSWTEFEMNQQQPIRSYNSVDSCSGDVSSYDESSLETTFRQQSTLSLGMGSINLYIQMELCDDTLANWLEKRNRSGEFQPSANREMIRQILTGVSYLHTKKIIHRDLKPLNILLSYDKDLPHFLVKITDFGLSRELLKVQCIISEENEESISIGTDLDALTIGVGSPPYISPEQKYGPTYSVKSDIYCVGLMAFEIFFPMNTASEKYRNFDMLARSHIEDNFVQQNKEQAEFVLLLTKKNPDDRPTAACALSNNCLKELPDRDQTSEDAVLRRNLELLKERCSSVEEDLKVAVLENKKLKDLLSVCTCQNSIFSYHSSSLS